MRAGKSLGENLGVSALEVEIWGHSCCLHPSGGALWAEEQAYCLGLQGDKLGSVGGSNREAEKSTRFQIKHALGMNIGKFLMSQSLSFHICIMKHLG